MKFIFRHQALLNQNISHLYKFVRIIKTITATEDKVKLNCQTGIALAQYKLAYVTEAWSTINAVYEADKNVTLFLSLSDNR